ncbi:MAG TPA: HEAT repeat domain-containing protein, partial [Ktedonobacterales bacterium]|nr:HEAT repeat domain-containing protein [Ktedonobacterales bacterium]
MLESMDQVDWAQLWAYGPATEVPRLIRALASSTDRTEREAVLAQLTERVIYQGSILQVTPYAVPFLLERLTIETLEEHADLFALLTLIARAQPFAIGAGALDAYPDEAAAPPELHARLAEEREWMRQAYEAVEQGVPTYLTFLAHPAGDTRRWAAYLLSRFPGQAPRSVPALRARLDQEDDALVQAAVVASLGDLLEAGTALPQFLTPYLRAETPPLLRSVAALAFARHAGPAAPPAVVQVLLEAIAHRKLVEASFGQLPQVYAAYYDDFPTHVCQTLARTGPEHAIPALAEVLHGYSSAGGDMKELRLIEEVQLWGECRGVAESLLAAAFTEGELLGGVRQPKAVALPLRQLQRMALTVLVEEEALWRPYAQLGYSQEY